MVTTVNNQPARVNLLNGCRGRQQQFQQPQLLLLPSTHMLLATAVAAAAHMRAAGYQILAHLADHFRPRLAPRLVP